MKGKQHVLNVAYSVASHYGCEGNVTTIVMLNDYLLLRWNTVTSKYCCPLPTLYEIDVICAIPSF